MRIRLNLKALNRSLLTEQTNRRVSRRELFAGGAAAVASLSPGVQAAVVALAHGPITVKVLRRGKHARAVISCASGANWTVDTALFAGSPALTVEPGPKSTTVKLTGARYPGTRVALNFEAEIPNVSTGKISFHFFECGDGSASFKVAVRADGLLNGTSRATGSIDKKTLNGLFHDLHPGGSVTSLAKGTIAFSASGMLKAVADMELVTDECVWPISDFSLASQARMPETLVTGKDKCHTVLTASKRESWSGTVAIEAESGWQVKGAADAFDTWFAECHETGSVATMFSGDGSLNVALPGVILLQATSPTLTSLGKNGEDLHFASLLGEDGSWVHHGDVSLHAAPITSEPFILSTNSKGDLHGEPVLHTKNIALTLEDAIVTVGLPKLPNMVLGAESSNIVKNSQGRPPITQRPPITRPPVVPPVFQRPKPDTTVTTSKVWIPSIEVVRPQDFLNLKFEFANLHLTSTPGATPYFEREIASRPAYIIVEFPPQSIGEQSFFAGSMYQPPVRTLLSGPTRLVFYIPITQKTVKFSLTEEGGLLDWSLWSLSVAPAAFSTFSGTVSIDPTWKHPIQDITIGGSREFEKFAEKTPTISERLASMFQIQRQTTADQGGIRQIIQNPIIRQKSPNIIHFKPNILEVSPQKDPTKVIPGIPTGRTGAIYRYFTNIEIPAQIQMSPDENAHFFHVRSADTGPLNVRGPKRSAIWHTRLGSFATMAGKVYRAESSDDGEWFYIEDNQGRLGPYKSSYPIHPNLRAVDSTDYDIPNNLSGQFSITREQRKELVDTMTMRSGNPALDTPPFIADRLMLTSLGGFLKGAWNWGETSPPHSIVAWRHWSTLGREQFVYIREAGFLVPTGHRVDKVTITQRKFRSSGQGVVARLESKTYLIVTNPLVNLEPDAARKLGFSQIVCKTKTTPDLSFVGILKLAGTSEQFEFAMVGTDMDGHQVSWTQPSTFRLFSDGINPNLTWANSTVVNLKTSGHPIAFAPSQNPSDGTTFPCKLFSMGAIAGTPNPDKGIPAFRPTMTLASINVPAVEQYLSGSNLGAVLVEFDPGYKNSGFTGGAEVFLSLKVPVSQGFTDGKKFGGMVNPSIKMEVISRKHGPIPRPTGNSVKYAMTDSEEFASTDAEFVAPEVSKLLGVVSIWDLLPDSIDMGGNGSDAPKFKVAKVFADDKFGIVGSGSPNSAIIGAVSSFSWQPTLKDWAPASWPFSQKVFTKYKGQAQLRIDAAYYQIQEGQGTNFPAGSSYFLNAGIYNFQINAADQVHILVDKIQFSSQTGSNSSIKVDIDDIQFVNMLSFVGVLQSVLAPGSKGYHFSSSTPSSDILASTDPVPFGLGIEPILDINASGLTVGFSLSIPTIGIGVVTVMNIAVISEMILPWFGDALTFRFAFCKRDAPFAVSVYGIAGGGFLGIELTPGGIKSIEGSIEFGAMVALNFGVASGSISLMAGFYFKYEVAGGTTLTGYVRLVGEVDVLGLISASLEMYLGLSYNTSSRVLSGDAAISVRISLFCFHKTVTVHAHKEFAGSSGGADVGTVWASNSPPELFGDHERTLFTKAVTNQQFKNYCSAFGGNA